MPRHKEVDVRVQDIQPTLNDKSLMALPVLERTYEKWFSGNKGLGICVTPKGTKTWLLRYRRDSGQLIKMSLGRYVSGEMPRSRIIPIKKAKELYLENRLQILKGEDPAQLVKAKKEQTRKQLANEAGAITFAGLIEEYIERHAKQKKKSWRNDEYCLNKEFLPPLGNRKAKDVTRADIRKVLDKMENRGVTTGQNRALEIVRKMYNWGMSVDLVEHNPCTGIEKPVKEKVGERCLDEKEIRKLWHSLEHYPIKTALAVKLMVILGPRVLQLVQAKWTEFDLDTGVWIVPSERMKVGKPHLTMLPPLAIKLIKELQSYTGETEFLFPSSDTSKPVDYRWLNAAIKKSPYKKQLKVDNFSARDLRRTAATQLAKSGVPNDLIGRILSHTATGVTEKHYNLYQYQQEKLDAMRKWENRLNLIIKDELPKNVVELKVATS